MNKQNLDQLEQLLSQFFNEYDLNKAHFTKRNKVGKLIKENLIRFGRWRSHKRRSSAPLHEQMIAKLHKENKQNKSNDCPF